jgi:peptide/nickel transport system permease protein
MGAIVGFFRTWWAGGFMRGLDLLQAFPIFVLALALVAALGNRVSNVIVVLAALNVPIFVRLVRTEVLALAGRDFVDAAICAGRRRLGIVFSHLIPNSIGPAVAQTSVSVGWTILLTAGLSFIGAGVQVPTPEWGLMVSQGAQNMITGQWWVALFPGLIIGLTVFSFAALGEALEAALDE